jgi:hypothetical protein
VLSYVFNQNQKYGKKFEIEIGERETGNSERILVIANDIGCWLLAVGYWLLAIGCWLLAVGCWLLAVGYWLLAVWLFGCWLLAVGYWLLAVGYWLLAVGCFVAINVRNLNILNDLNPLNFFLSTRRFLHFLMYLSATKSRSRLVHQAHHNRRLQLPGISAPDCFCFTTPTPRCPHYFSPLQFPETRIPVEREREREREIISELRFLGAVYASISHPFSGWGRMTLSTFSPMSIER